MKITSDFKHLRTVRACREAESKVVSAAEAWAMHVGSAAELRLAVEVLQALRKLEIMEAV